MEYWTWESPPLERNGTGVESLISDDPLSGMMFQGTSEARDTLCHTVSSTNNYVALTIPALLFINELL